MAMTRTGPTARTLHMHQRLSLYPLLTQSSVTLNFPHKNPPVRDAAFRENSDHLLLGRIAVQRT